MIEFIMWWIYGIIGALLIGSVGTLRQKTLTVIDIVAMFVISFFGMVALVLGVLLVVGVWISNYSKEIPNPFYRGGKK